MGTLYDHCVSQIDDRIAGKTLAANGAIFSAANPTGNPPTFTRNVNCWAADIDLSPNVALLELPGNQRSYKYGGILIAPDVIMVMYHSRLGNGYPIWFVDNSNTVIARTIAAGATVGSPISGDPNYYDLHIHRLDSAVPGITPAQLMKPEQAMRYFPEVPYLQSGPSPLRNSVPLWTSGQTRKASVRDWVILLNLGTYWAGWNDSPINWPNLDRLEFFVEWISGDSGHPACLVIDSKLVVLSFTAEQGAMPGQFEQELSVAFAAAGSTEAWSFVDLSAWEAPASTYLETMFSTGVVTLKIPPTKDAYAPDGGGNFGDVSGAYLGNGYLSGNIRNRVFIEFDLSTVPPNAQILSAALVLTGTTSFTGGGSRTFTFNPLTTSWAEMTVTWTVPWTTAGGDYSSDNEASVSVANGATSMSFDVTDAALAGFNATAKVLSGVLRGPELTGQNDYFAPFMREWLTNRNYQPELTLTYVVPGGETGEVTSTPGVEGVFRSRPGLQGVASVKPPFTFGVASRSV